MEDQQEEKELEQQEIQEFEETVAILVENLINDLNKIRDEFNVSSTFFTQYVVSTILNVSLQIAIQSNITKKWYNKLYKNMWDQMVITNNKVINYSNTIH